MNHPAKVQKELERVSILPLRQFLVGGVTVTLTLISISKMYKEIKEILNTNVHANKFKATQ